MSIYYSAYFNKVGEYIHAVSPTVMTAVPRLFEKVYHRIIKKGMAEKGWKRKVFTRSVEEGQRYGELKDTRRRIPASLRLNLRLECSLVLSIWREGDLVRSWYYFYGGAPLT